MYGRVNKEGQYNVLRIYRVGSSRSLKRKEHILEVISEWVTGLHVQFELDKDALYHKAVSHVY